MYVCRRLLLPDLVHMQQSTIQSLTKHTNKHNSLLVVTSFIITMTRGTERDPNKSDVAPETAPTVAVQVGGPPYTPEPLHYSHAQSPYVQTTAPPPPVPPTNTKALWSLICGIVGILVLGIILGPIAICLGVSAKQEIQSTGSRDAQGQCQANAGIVCGSVALVLWIILVAVWAD